jgi:hypothetical protein
LNVECVGIAMAGGGETGVEGRIRSSRLHDLATIMARPAQRCS